MPRKIGTSGHRYRPKRWYLLADFARKLNKASDGDAGAIVPGVGAVELHELASDLLKLAGGKDAREVFGQQASRGNKSRSVEAYNAACAYWHARLGDPAADDAGAVLAAQKRYLTDPPSPSRIRRIAREHREAALQTLEGWSYWIDKQGTPRKKCRMDNDTTKLRKYLGLKSQHIKD